ncbi:hypothetical protein [Acaryochloris sp. CCMEE 5410]|uniref:hypothetical protein n=1 Tax=Acaryochloris sp. CCMEE 5410 TaxID=310037 RepID=UPI0002484EBA|nr:hypothetical protein [Acaryochloris sp. CCMEE 5410]KAI9132599.1 hypothetical protein ON05_003980 [Acaryochloris sp. CCMEE 5410]
MILLSDANVLIDLGYVNGLDVLCKLGKIEVLDVVLQECDHPKQPDLVTSILECGVQEIQTEYEWIQPAQKYRTGRLSLPDSLNFYYAKSFNRHLLTNEKPLRELCKQESVLVNGTLWIIEESWKNQLRSQTDLCEWLRVLPTLERRLPKKEIQLLKQKLGC